MKNKFNTLLQFIKKEFYHILRDKKTLTVLIGMPVAQLIIFGYAIRTEFTNTKIGYLDYSKDEMTKEISDKLLSSGYFLPGKYLNSDSEIEAAFKAGEVKQVVVFEQNFAANLMKEGIGNILLVNDASDPNAAIALNGYTSSIIKNYQLELMTKTGLMNKGSSGISSETRMLYNPELKSVYMFVPGLIALILMLLSTMMTSIAITREKERGTMEVMLVSPLSPALIIIGKVVPYSLLALLNSMSVLSLSMLIFDVPFNGSFWVFLLETFIFLSTSLSFGILISTIVHTQQLALMISLVGTLMPTMLLSGFIYPIENMPGWLQIFSHVIPAKWFLIALKSIMLKGLGFEYIWKESLILLGMTTLILIASIKKFKIRLS